MPVDDDGMIVVAWRLGVNGQPDAVRLQCCFCHGLFDAIFGHAVEAYLTHRRTHDKGGRLLRDPVLSLRASALSAYQHKVELAEATRRATLERELADRVSYFKLDVMRSFGLTPNDFDDVLHHDPAGLFVNYQGLRFQLKPRPDLVDYSSENWKPDKVPNNSQARHSYETTTEYYRRTTRLVVAIHCTSCSHAVMPCEIERLTDLGEAYVAWEANFGDPPVCRSCRAD